MTTMTKMTRHMMKNRRRINDKAKSDSPFEIIIRRKPKIQVDTESLHFSSEIKDSSSSNYLRSSHYHRSSCSSRSSRSSCSFSYSTSLFVLVTYFLYKPEIRLFASASASASVAASASASASVAASASASASASDFLDSISKEIVQSEKRNSEGKAKDERKPLLASTGEEKSLLHEIAESGKEAGYGKEAGSVGDRKSDFARMKKIQRKNSDSRLKGEKERILEIPAEVNPNPAKENEDPSMVNKNPAKEIKDSAKDEEDPAKESGDALKKIIAPAKEMGDPFKKIKDPAKEVKVPAKENEEADTVFKKKIKPKLDPDKVVENWKNFIMTEAEAFPAKEKNLPAKAKSISANEVGGTGADRKKKKKKKKKGRRQQQRQRRKRGNRRDRKKQLGIDGVEVTRDLPDEVTLHLPDEVTDRRNQNKQSDEVEGINERSPARFEEMAESLLNRIKSDFETLNLLEDVILKDPRTPLLPLLLLRTTKEFLQLRKVNEGVAVSPDVGVISPAGSAGAAGAAASAVSTLSSRPAGSSEEKEVVGSQKKEEFATRVEKLFGVGHGNVMGSTEGKRVIGSSDKAVGSPADKGRGSKLDQVVGEKSSSADFDKGHTFNLVDGRTREVLERLVDLDLDHTDEKEDEEVEGLEALDFLDPGVSTKELRRLEEEKEKAKKMDTERDRERTRRLASKNDRQKNIEFSLFLEPKERMCLYENLISEFGAIVSFGVKDNNNNDNNDDDECGIQFFVYENQKLVRFQSTRHLRLTIDSRPATVYAFCFVNDAGGRRDDAGGRRSASQPGGDSDGAGKRDEADKAKHGCVHKPRARKVRFSLQHLGDDDDDDDVDRDGRIFTTTKGLSSFYEISVNVIRSLFIQANMKVLSLAEFSKFSDLGKQINLASTAVSVIIWFVAVVQMTVVRRLVGSRLSFLDWVEEDVKFMKQQLVAELTLPWRFLAAAWRTHRRVA